MIKVTRINKENSNVFLGAVDTLTLAVCDIFLGAYDDKTDTACGILAAESEENEQAGYTLAIRQIYVDENWRRKGVGKALLTALEYLSVTVGAKTILCSHMEVYKERNDLSLFFESLGFKRTRSSLPVYGFRLSEIEAGTKHEQIICSPLKSIGAREWRSFVQSADAMSVVVNVRSYYEENVSFIAYDKNYDIQGALLCSRREGVLFVDEVLVVKGGSELVVDSLVYHTVTEAEKIYSPGTEIGVVLANQEQEMILQELTEFKCEKIGAFIAHVLN